MKFAAFIAALCLALPVYASEDLKTQHEQMLYPVVLVEAPGGTGSGTVIFSDKHDGKMETYVLTNYHVIQGAVQVAKAWDPSKGEEVMKETRATVKVNWFLYNDMSREVGSRGKTADIVAYDSRFDLALLKTKDGETTEPFVAKVSSRDTTLHLFETTYAVGAGLGEPPFPTVGMLSNLDRQFEGRRFILSSAPIIFGNSGGALFHLGVECQCYELIGVPSAVSATWSVPVSHMAWSIPIDIVRDFLAQNQYGFVVGEANKDPGPALVPIPEPAKEAAPAAPAP